MAGGDGGNRGSDGDGTVGKTHEKRVQKTMREKDQEIIR